MADSAGLTPATYGQKPLNQYVTVKGAAQGFGANGNQDMVRLKNDSLRVGCAFVRHAPSFGLG